MSQQQFKQQFFLEYAEIFLPQFLQKILHIITHYPILNGDVVFLVIHSVCMYI